MALFCQLYRTAALFSIYFSASRGDPAHGLRRRAEEQGTDSFSLTPFPSPPLKTGMGLIGGWRYEREGTLTPFSHSLKSNAKETEELLEGLAARTRFANGQQCLGEKIRAELFRQDFYARNGSLQIRGKSRFGDLACGTCAVPEVLIKEE